MDTAIAVKDDFKVTMADVRRYIAPTATDKEVFLFMGIARSYGLNPLKREIHLVKYGTAPASIVTGYEVYLKRAERTGKLDGWDVVVSPDGQEATITIFRKDWSHPFRWTVYRNEFDKGQSTWKSMASFMLRKVCIAQAFRLCFSDEMGGLPYIPEEMPQDKGGGVSSDLPKDQIEYDRPAEVVEAVPVPEPAFDAPFDDADEPVDEPRVISEAQQRRLFAKAKLAGWPTLEIKAYLSEVHGITSSASIPVSKYDKIIEWVESHTGYTPTEAL